MKQICFVLLFGALLTGCATSTVESRKLERPAAYSTLSADQKALVDRGNIKVGMSMDAVYIAWGAPSQILAGESGASRIVTWLYHGSYLEEFGCWRQRPYYRGRYVYPETYYEHDYYPRNYVQAEVIFEDGAVKQWRTLPQPPY